MLALKHASVCSDDIGDGCSANGALESFRLEFQATGNASAHVATVVYHRVNHTF